MTIEQLQAARDAIVSAMAKGVYSVQSGQEQVTFQTVEQMQRALDTLNAEIASLTGRSSRTSLVQHGRG